MLTKSVIKYFTEFIKYIRSMEWDKKTLQYIYKRDLKKEVKDKIIRHKSYTDIDN